jgi:ABC-type antimicrobial peptide transport system permease subunit
MALGASRNGVVWLILREAIVLTAGGVLIGTPAVFLVGQTSRMLLYGIGQFDPPGLRSLFWCCLYALCWRELCLLVERGGWIPWPRFDVSDTIRRQAGFLRHRPQRDIQRDPIGSVPTFVTARITSSAPVACWPKSSMMATFSLPPNIKIY